MIRIQKNLHLHRLRSLFCHGWLSRLRWLFWRRYRRGRNNMGTAAQCEPHSHDSDFRPKNLEHWGTPLGGAALPVKAIACRRIGGSAMPFRPLAVSPIRPYADTPNTDAHLPL